MSPVLGEVLLSIKDLEKSFGDRPILESMTFTIHRGARIGILGSNGCGKSTFMRILAGQDDDHGGEVIVSSGVRVGYVPQEPILDLEKTVRENVDEGAAAVYSILDQYNELAADLGDGDPKKMEKFDRLQEQIDLVGGWEIDHQIDVAMGALRLAPPESIVGNLSGGERRRVALCRELMSHPDVLILDEPTNHLDASTIEWLELYVDEYEGTVVMVTHDRYFLDNVADFMVELENGHLRIFEGNYSDYLGQKAVLIAREAKAEAKRQNILKRELDWLRSTPKARTTRNQSRVKNYKQLLNDGPIERTGEASLMLPVGPRLGDRVVTCTGLSKRYGERTLFCDLDFQVGPGEIVGVVGPNGSGKTTFLSIVAGHRESDDGTVERGETVEVVYLEQGRESLEDDKTVYQEVAGGNDSIQVGGRTLHVREFLSRFGIRGALQQTRVGDLSGGERNRLLLAKTFRSGANLLLMDEPTNDLDIPTLRVLEEALEGFAGSAIVVTHDRYFLDRIATSILVFEEGKEPRYYGGTYEDYYEARKESGDLEYAGKRRRSSYRKMIKR
ncbi:MAG: energy-dependent translational throttle protein EttA [Planctomycetota bacterium]|jgi:ATP-binding cassette ChvD family protein|nr:energy-dependent translational throttle protein EttA [Planctomycetota bacterium]